MSMTSHNIRPRRTVEAKTSIAERERGLHYISRIEGDHGWNVRPPNGGPSRFFADRKHGGRKRALEMAIKWRKDHGGANPPRRKSNLCEMTNKSGETIGYNVQIEREGQVLDRYFGKLKWGSVARAKAAAIAYRDQIRAAFDHE